MFGSVALAFLACPSDRPTAFVGVDVVPMDREIVLRDQTVLVRDGKIAALGPAKDVAVPEDALRIEGQGRYLMPGPADMHVHAWDAGGLALFLANGVTTVRIMFGSPVHVGWRASVVSGELFGPTIYTAGPIIDGNPPVWPGSTVLVDPAEAEKVVIEQKEAGYDFLKVYARLPLASYDALVEAAREHGMRVMGHVPSAVGLPHAIASKQESIEHLDGWPDLAQREDSPYRSKVSFVNSALAWKHVDDGKIAEAAKLAAASGTWNCPTLVVFQKWATGEEAQAMLDRPEMRFVSAWERWFWRPENNYMKNMTASSIEAVRSADSDRKRAVGILHGAGARILLGTDVGNPFVVAGFSLHEELANLVASGLSPYEALRAGTSGAAEFMRAKGEWGSVAVGFRADLLLLEGNPLEDVRNAARRAGVMVRGQWLEETELRAKLEAIAEQHAPPAEPSEPEPKKD